MATIFQSPIRRKNPTTGKMENAFDAKGKQLFHPKWRTIIVDHKGMRKTFTLSTNKQQSQKQADSLETREREIKNGLRAVPEAPDVNAVRPIEEVLLEYMAWGKAQGGKKGSPWDSEHAFKKERHLDFWRQALGLETLGDLYGILPKVETECRTLLANGNGGKTVTHKAMNLRSFILWCRKRKYLTEDPLEELGKFDTAPKSIRRAMAMEEFQTLLEKCAPHRRLLYEVAVCSGLRENELRQLEPKHLDRERCGIRVEREIDKARKERLQLIPAALMERLEAFVASGEAKKLYAAAYSQQGQREGKKKQPRNPLLYVPANSATMLKRDLEAAGIPAVTDKGKLDFHALRTAYINFVIDTGADVKTAQELARHASPHMTMNVYGRARDEKCREVVEAVGKRVYCDKSGQETPQDCHENYIKLTQVPEKLSPGKTTTACTASGCSDDTLVRKRGLEPKFGHFRRIA